METEKTVKPITPDEVVSEKGRAIPPEVIEAFNECIARSYIDGAARVGQDTVVERIRARLPGVARCQIFEWHWLDVEPLYEEAGWEVEYNKPAYCETHEAFFMFRRRK